MRDHPPVRRHHRRRHGAAVVHAADAARQAGRGRGRPAGQQDGHGPGDGRARQADGPDFTFFVVYGRVNHLVDLSKVEVVERDYPLLTAEGGQRRGQAAAAAQAGRGRRLHRHRRAHRRHRRDPQHQGLRGGEGPGVLPRDQGGQPRRPGLGAGAGRPRPRRRPTRCWSPRWSPSATRTCTTPGRCRPRSGRPTRREAAAAGRRRPRFDEHDGRRARRRPDLRPRHHARRGGQLPGPRPGHQRTPSAKTGMDRAAPGRADRHAPPVRAVLARPLRRQPRRRRVRRWACSATSPPRCASAPTATRACSRPTPTCSSGHRSRPATCSR